MFGRATNYPICEGEEEEEEEWDRRESWEVREGDCAEVIKNNVLRRIFSRPLVLVGRFAKKKLPPLEGTKRRFDMRRICEMIKVKVSRSRNETVLRP